MTEAEWLASQSPREMIRFLENRAEDRASARPGPMLITPDQQRHWVRACRWFADRDGYWANIEKERLEYAVHQWAIPATDSYLDTCPLALRAALLREVCNPFLPALPKGPRTAPCTACEGTGQTGEFRASVCEWCGGDGKELAPCPWLSPTVLSLARAAAEEVGEVCPECKGTGNILHHPEGVPFSQSLADLEDCPTCSGSGRVGVLLDAGLLGILADCLESEGCQEQAILMHLRGWEVCCECLAGQEDCDCKSGWCSLRSPHIAGCWVLALLLGQQ